MLIFVLYDSIENSVFSSQILQLIKKKVKQHQKILLISFEKQIPTTQLINQKIPKIIGLKTIFLKKLPFFGTISLIPAVRQLKKQLQTLEDYEIIARGPHAGLICAHAIDSFIKCTSFTIQARGLVAEEYRYAKQHTKGLTKMLHNFRYKQFQNLEKTVYSKVHLFPHTKIEAVSSALKEYLVKHFAAKEDNITIATEDIPEKIKSNKVAKLRLETRKQLNIPAKTIIYCYNGSIKPWQCPDMVVDFFTKKVKACDNNFLLVLTQNKNQFENLIRKKNISSDKYLITTVSHDEIYKHLAACDYGIIFRKKNIINWVSRPTKVLEYKAVGLHIIHNNTVEWLVSSEKGAV